MNLKTIRNMFRFSKAKLEAARVRDEQIEDLIPVCFVMFKCRLCNHRYVWPSQQDMFIALRIANRETHTHTCKDGRTGLYQAFGAYANTNQITFRDWLKSLRDNIDRE